MILSRHERRPRDLMPGDVLDISPYCGPGPVHDAGVRVTGPPRFHCHQDIEVDGKLTRIERQQIPCVCAVCEKPYFHTALPHDPVRLGTVTPPSGHSSEPPF
ncbi:hypothetical protein [Streptomyces acidiscabies]|uniref:hypothetical protein n=1 Tax=Streptomyces acidiscabies TaxID=42234 RepID=UPI0038F623B8